MDPSTTGASRVKINLEQNGGKGGFKPPPSRTLYTVPALYLLPPPFLHFSIAKYCTMLHHFSPTSQHLGNPASHPLFSASHTPPAPFTPGLPPPVPLHKMLQSKLKSTINCCYQKLHFVLYQQALNLFYHHQFFS